MTVPDLVGRRSSGSVETQPVEFSDFGLEVAYFEGDRTVSGAFGEFIDLQSAAIGKPPFRCRAGRPVAIFWGARQAWTRPLLFRLHDLPEVMFKHRHLFHFR
jgi:hypothetical protein